MKDPSAIVAAVSPMSGSLWAIAAQPPTIRQTPANTMDPRMVHLPSRWETAGARPHTPTCIFPPFADRRDRDGAFARPLFASVGGGEEVRATRGPPRNQASGHVF